MDPDEMTDTGTIASWEPSRRIDPLPNCFSIWLSVAVNVRARSLSSMVFLPGYSKAGGNSGGEPPLGGSPSIPLKQNRAILFYWQNETLVSRISSPPADENRPANHSFTRTGAGG